MGKLKKTPSPRSTDGENKSERDTSVMRFILTFDPEPPASVDESVKQKRKLAAHAYTRKCKRYQVEVEQSLSLVVEYSK